MGTVERRARERNERRNQILDAARTVFWRKGFNRATMPEIAAEAELAPGTLYLHFANKDALYAELLVEGYEILYRQLRRAADAPGSPRVRAEAIIDAFFAFANKHREYFDVIFFILQKEASRLREMLPKEQMQRLAAHENACKEIAVQIFGEIPGEPREEVQVIVDAMWSMLAGVVFFWQGDGPTVSGPIMRRAKALMLAAVFGR